MLLSRCLCAWLISIQVLPIRKEQNALLLPNATAAPFCRHSTFQLCITSNILFSTAFLCVYRLAVVVRVGIFFRHVDRSVSSVGRFVYEGLHGNNKQRQLMPSKRLIKNSGRM